VLLLLLVTACESPDDVPAVAHEDTVGIALDARTDDDEIHFRCEDVMTFSVQFGDGMAHIRLPESELALPQVETASGARYAADGYELYTQNDEATFTTPDATYSDCTVQDEASVWEQARNRGVIFRALGQEPGWVVELQDDDRMIVSMDYGETELELRDVTRSEEEDGFTLTGHSGGRDVLLHARNERCQDVMSGERFEMTVTMTVNGDQLNGCGRTL
jgi:membrane-bound inhibitor of C-type lysozyme